MNFRTLQLYSRSHTWRPRAELKTQDKPTSLSHPSSHPLRKSASCIPYFLSRSTGLRCEGIRRCGTPTSAREGRRKRKHRVVADLPHLDVSVRLEDRGDELRIIRLDGHLVNGKRREIDGRQYRKLGPLDVDQQQVDVLKAMPAQQYAAAFPDAST